MSPKGRVFWDALDCFQPLGTTSRSELSCYLCGSIEEAVNESIGRAAGRFEKAPVEETAIASLASE